MGLAAYDDFDQMKIRLNDNLGMEFKQDCSNRMNTVDFASVFAVFFMLGDKCLIVLLKFAAIKLAFLFV